jgi:hypothetical protein
MTYQQKIESLQNLRKKRNCGISKTLETARHTCVAERVLFVSSDPVQAVLLL